MAEERFHDTPLATALDLNMSAQMEEAELIR
jgi:hypothetical protein